MDEELYHHGIKGMKWGVRRYQRPDGRYTPAGKERYSKDSEKSKKETSELSDDRKKAIRTGAAIVAGSLAIVGGVYLYKTLNPSYLGHYKTISSAPLKEMLSEFPDGKDIRFKKGSILQRITSDAVADYTNRGRIYVSKYFRDNLKYMDRMPQESWLKYDTPYVHKLKSSMDIVAPSPRKAAEIYMNTFSDPNKVMQKDFMNMVTYLIREPDNPETKRYVEALRKLGYNALVDENDRGWTKAPLILLNPSEVVSSSSSHKLNAIEKVISRIGS